MTKCFMRVRSSPWKNLFFATCRRLALRTIPSRSPVSKRFTSSFCSTTPHEESNPLPPCYSAFPWSGKPGSIDPSEQTPSSSWEGGQQEQGEHCPWREGRYHFCVRWCSWLNRNTAYDASFLGNRGERSPRNSSCED